VMPYIELAILRFINTILRMYIAIKPTIRKVEDLFHIKTGDGIKIALRAGEIAAYALAGAVGLVLVAFGLLALPFAALGGAIYGVIYAVTHAKEIFGTVKGAVSKAFHGAVDAVWSAIKAIPGLVGDAITAAIAFFINIPDALGSAVAAAVNLFDAGINALPDVIDAVVSTISDAIAAVPGAFNDVVSAIGSAFAQIPTLLADGVDFVTGLPAKFAEAGDQIINGLVEAIKSGAAKVITAVENLGKDTVKAAKKIFHISSPSREFYEIGTMNTEGLALGHEDGADRVKGSIDAIGDLPESSPIRRGGGAKNVIHAVFHITGGNAKENAQEIKRVLEDLFETHAIEVSGGTEATA
jgi:phage-related protein